MTTTRREPSKAGAYVLDEQVGFLLRQVSQRHSTIFAALIGEELTATQWAVLSKLFEVGATSQNLLGRLTAMDAATVKGVVDRLMRRDLVATRPDLQDGRRLVVELTQVGTELVGRLLPRARAITEETLAPLNAAERSQLEALLKRLR
ncbi:transcriptional regulator, MarR family [Arboricoccus pini]|uniref:Transcriptional regulator, MarR family n=1 Tax=Arboricoccus pini TaxID=1963835 RepID=A0A212RJ35_9PROT|nr:MarR family transcriptional regulator [Arboricoccus pini]SNB72422.1 transcriptional regulator, MarR family [Arboricoccus pini]